MPVDDIPPSRIQLTYKAKVDGVEKMRELPFRQLVVGDFTLREKEGDLESREKISVNTSNFNQVMEKMKLHLDLQVPNRLSGKEGDELSVSLDFKSLDAFNPDEIVKSVPELKRWMVLRTFLQEMQTKAINNKDFAKTLLALCGDLEGSKEIVEELKKRGFTLDAGGGETPAAAESSDTSDQDSE